MCRIESSALLREEAEAGVTTPEYYAAFDERVRATKRQLLAFLITAKREGKRIAGYGAPAKGNTLLNYCGVRSDFLDYTVDASPHKQGLFLPGTRIPIHAPRSHPRDPAGLPVDPALEPTRGDHHADGAHPRLGRPVPDRDTRCRGAGLIVTATPSPGAEVIA